MRGRSCWEIKETLRRDFPQFADIEIPTRMVNSVTLSTMHGCPPDEIERIARYMLEERKLHTIVKMNPTLLGKERCSTSCTTASASPTSTSPIRSSSTTWRIPRRSS